MSAPRPNPPRRSIFAVWRWRWWTWLIPLLLPGLYLLSMAPLVRLEYLPWQQSVVHNVHDWQMYRPVNWFIDHSLLRHPLLLWARVWGVGGDFLIRSMLREVDRDYRRSNFPRPIPLDD